MNCPACRRPCPKDTRHVIDYGHTPNPQRHNITARQRAQADRDEGVVLSYLVGCPAVTQPNIAKIMAEFRANPVTYGNYEEYLASDLWKHIRTAIRERDGGQCRICHNQGSDVHHLSYSRKVMEGRQLNKLVLLCRPCHDGLTFDSAGKKRTSRDALALFYKRAKIKKPKKKKHPHRRTQRHRTDPFGSR